MLSVSTITVVEKEVFYPITAYNQETGVWWGRGGGDGKRRHQG